MHKTWIGKSRPDESMIWFTESSSAGVRWSLSPSHDADGRCERALYCGSLCENSNIETVVFAARANGLSVDVVAELGPSRDAFRRLRVLLDHSWPLQDRYLGDLSPEAIAQSLDSATGWLVIDATWQHLIDDFLQCLPLPTAIVGQDNPELEFAESAAKLDGDRPTLERWFRDSGAREPRPPR